MGTQKAREISHSLGEPALLSTSYGLGIVAGAKSREGRGRALEGDDGASKVGWRGGVGEKEGVLEEGTEDLGSRSDAAI